MSLPNLLNQTITVYVKSAYDAFGRETYTTGATYAARFQQLTKSRFLPNGQVITIDAIAYLDGSPTISINDKISYSGIDYKVHGKNVSVDGQGNNHHTKLELMRWDQG